MSAANVNTQPDPIGVSLEVLLGNVGTKCVKRQEAKHGWAQWNMCMLNTVPMVTELGKHSTANVSESAQMQ